jgi:hypothetical protein
MVTPGFQLVEAWHEPGASPRPSRFRCVASSAPEERHAFFRLILEGLLDEGRLRKFPFVPPSASLLLFVPRGADDPWQWHQRPGFYFDIRSRDHRVVYRRCDQNTATRVIDTEALWSACWVHKEFSHHSGELSDVKIDWLAERITEKGRRDFERWG